MTTAIFSLLSANNIYPFINLEQHKKYLLKHQLNYKTKSFGAFVSVEREINKLKKWPEEIHGCLGDYEYSFKSITKEDLLNRVIKLGSRSAFVDNRRNYFPSLINDYLANIKVYIMLNPIYQVNNSGIITLKSKKKIKFNNHDYGLIVSQNSNPQATYLPDVFPKSTWKQITDRLKNKGGVINSLSNNISNISKNTSNISYNAYKTDIISLSLLDFFSNKLILSLRYLEIVLSMKFNSNGIPIYSINQEIYNSNNNPINQEIYNPTEYVRNCGICSDIIKAVYFIGKYNYKLLQMYKTQIKQIITKCKNYLLSIYDLYSKNTSTKSKYRQACSFVIVGLIYLSKEKTYSKQIKTFCDDILTNLDKLEERFEYGECLVAVNTALLFNLYKLKKIEQNLINKKTLKIINKISLDLDSIFQINWLIQMNCLSNNYNLLDLLITKLINIFENYYNKEIVLSSNKNNYILDKNILKLETNFIVVMYEAVLNLLFLNMKKQIKNINKLYEIFVKLSIVLVNRKNGKNNYYGLYTFNNGNIRYDISGHSIVI